MNIRTDLAVERREMNTSEEIDGVNVYYKESPDCKATVIEITSVAGEKALSKPQGKYITLEMESFPDSSTLNDSRLDMLTEALEELIPADGTVLIAGLGNPDITPDAIGPQCAEFILATRHIPEETAEELKLPRLRAVSVISPGVTGKTGIETGEIIAGIKEKIKPSAIILIDALAARSVSRLGTTVQLSNTGLEPGSGVGNRRKAINEETMGVPVISIGIPTVVDAATLSYDLTGKETENSEYSNMMVTPKDTDIITSGGARLIALGLNSALQKNLTREEIISLTMP
ncbi:MAG: GPR endopeptidase [Clostridia bacterium]|nr:GPR endopeptidase [Clostridia bacterium]